MNRNRMAACAALALGLLLTPAAQAARMNLVNDDEGTREGMDDPTPTLPVGGNPGRTLGEQRRIAYEYALALWGAVLESTVDIEVNAAFTPFDCTATTGGLGAARPNQSFNNFVGADPGVLYPGALANAMAGRRLDDRPRAIDLTTVFNGSIGKRGCLEDHAWYLGLDGKTPTGDFNFINVAMHELAHGLGVFYFLNVTSGALGGGGGFLPAGPGLTDTYTRNTYDITTDRPLDSPWTTDQQRAQMMVSPGRVVWNGPAVHRYAELLLDRDDRGYLVGADPRGRVQLYTPTAFNRGAAFAHFDTAASPNLLMEPTTTADLNAHIKLDLTPALLSDIGWRLNKGTAKLEDCDTRIPIIEEGGLIPGANLIAHEQMCLSSHPGNASARRACVIEHAQAMNAIAVISNAQLNQVRRCLTPKQ